MLVVVVYLGDKDFRSGKRRLLKQFLMIFPSLLRNCRRLKSLFDGLRDPTSDRTAVLNRFLITLTEHSIVCIRF